MSSEPFEPFTSGDETVADTEARSFRNFRVDDSPESAERARVRTDLHLTIADEIRQAVKQYGEDRKHWPGAVLAASAPFDMSARIVAERIRPIGGHVTHKVAAPVRTHRPHGGDAGVAWQPDTEEEVS